jgi:hypothetical protein
VRLEPEAEMSRAFVKDDDDLPEMRFTLPSRRHKSYDVACANALLEAARAGNTAAAEAATGYRWGDPHLKPHVELILQQEEARPEMVQDRRLIQLARRYLRAS